MPSPAAASTHAARVRPRPKRLRQSAAEPTHEQRIVWLKQFEARAGFSLCHAPANLAKSLGPLSFAEARALRAGCAAPAYSGAAWRQRAVHSESAARAVDGRCARVTPQVGAASLRWRRPGVEAILRCALRVGVRVTALAQGLSEGGSKLKLLSFRRGKLACLPALRLLKLDDNPRMLFAVR